MIARVGFEVDVLLTYWAREAIVRPNLVAR